jgi:SAM-dependent methyltransferase
VELVARRLQIDGPALRVLDWGCGRGNYVLHLRERGYSAFGAEPSTEAIERGRALLERRDVDVDHVIRPIGADGRVAFPDRSFHLVFSYYVLEHVADLARCAAEIHRLSAAGGFGFHVFPGRWRPIEGHLSMPMVHWLPKGRSRRALIRWCVALGIEPEGWAAGTTGAEKTQTYFDYSVGQTFYRGYSAIRDAFAASGFTITPQSLQLQHPRLDAVTKITGQHWLGQAVERLLLEFKTGELLMQRAVR